MSACTQESKESSTQVEHIIKDLSKLTEDQKIAYVSLSPETLILIMSKGMMKIWSNLLEACTCASH